ncbi:MAG: leucine-rich repeat protein [Oscillospiraceae bacterium]|nr:leucine-rich repeat protein [Oscillospiraceae bacterium]
MIQISGEEYIRNLTLGELCRVIEIPVPEGLDPDKHINKVYAHPEHSEKDSAVFITYYEAEQYHCRNALKKNPAVVFVHPECKAVWPEDKRVVAVDDPTSRCSRYLAKLRSLFPAKVVTVTGSIGKTTTVDMLKCVLGDAFKLHSHHSMTNSRDGVLRTIQRMHDDDEVYLQEVGAAQPGFVESSAVGLKPDVVVITNISEPHIDLYGSIENILKDKASLVEHMAPGGVAFFDSDNTYLHDYKTDRTVRYYAMDDPNADFRAENVESRDGWIHFDICRRNFDRRCSAAIQIFGEYNVRNALAAFAVGRHLGIDEEQIVQSLEKFRASGMRQNYVTIGGYHMLVDCFNSSPDSVIGSLQALETISVPEGGRRIAILGDIAHMEGIEEEAYTRVGANVADCHFDMMYCFGNGMRYTYEELVRRGFTNVLYTSDREELNQWIRDNVTQKDVTLYKSSQLVGALAKTIDAVYGTTFYLNSQRVPTSTQEIINRFKRVGDQVEYARLVTDKATEVTVPADVYGRPVYRISPSAFSKCRDLRRVVLPDTVLNIGTAAFYVCPKLTEVVLSKGLRMIEDSAFNYCTALERVELPDGVVHVGRRAFYDCQSLKEITIPASVGFIGEQAFDKCSEELVIRVQPGSYAEEYCKENTLSYTAE